jgi:putative transcriptional regulator
MIRILCALIVTIGLALPRQASPEPPAKSIFLVARAGLTDPNFRDSVVLVTHKAIEPTGVIINLPTDITLASLFPEAEQSAHAQDKLFFGGPVRPWAFTVLFRTAKPPRNAIEVIDGVYMSSDRDLLGKLLRDDAATELRVYSGFASWSTEQLEDEIGRGDWRMERSDAKMVFEKTPNAVWKLLKPGGGPRRIS